MIDPHESKEPAKARLNARGEAIPQKSNTALRKCLSEDPEHFFTEQDPTNEPTKARRRYGSRPSVDASITSTGVLRAHCRFNPRRDDLQTFLDELAVLKSTAQKLFKIRRQHTLQVEKLSKAKKGACR